MRDLMRCGCVALALLFGCLTSAQSSLDDSFGYTEGRIIDISTDGDENCVGGGAIVLLEGGRVVSADLPQSDPFVTVDLPPFRVGQRVEVYYSNGPDGRRTYVVTDWIRRRPLIGLGVLFLLASVVVARFKGLRAFVATGTSLVIIVSFIVPRILEGWNPVVVSIIGIGGILILAIYFVHGVNWSTSAAMAGTFLAVLITMGLGVLFSELAFLTGLGTEEAMMISAAAGQINLKGLLLAGLLVGALGALTDITIVQAAVVRELAHANPEMGAAELYRRGMNVGTDHVGSLINTLVLAYTGAALPLLLLLTLSDFTLLRALNLELVAAEIVHTLVGSIGLILGVPVTTYLAALLFRGDRLPLRPGELDHAHHH
ncbi:MAG: YibE/F family protein [Trueperaceae bacterium]|nr:MAG: YibE/F family protein [Trueperaceae bacterium]